MSKKRRKELLRKGFLIQNEVTNKILPQTINHIILLGSSFVVVLATLSSPMPHNICIYRALLSFLLLSVLSGVICISILAIDYYILGKKIQKIAKQKDINEKQSEFHTGKVYYFLILGTFIICFLTFVVAIFLLVIYAWN